MSLLALGQQAVDNDLASEQVLLKGSYRACLHDYISIKIHSALLKGTIKAKLPLKVLKYTRKGLKGLPCLLALSFPRVAAGFAPISPLGVPFVRE